ncbi:DUF2712 domain-containing protein [Marvinbryantia formatexigens]|nr:DUF2712 domain-containing protein [Marvinbryantia formatexigens]UWO23467.1 hypothetical protein NQ534_13525 [Marvinbryantia formatexigens DSM 14469]SDG57525.1 hypothetical protein SAMN05660368_02844 [Marvinbryantia formatexigens]
MKKKRMLNRIFAFLTAATLALPVGMASSATASNWTDTEYYKDYSGDGGDVYTEWRQKQDSSSVYICHQGSVDVFAAVLVSGYNGIYSGSNGMYGKGSYVGVPTGQGFYIINYVAESFKSDYNKGNYKYIRLALCPTTHNQCSLYGVWSPDSI